MHQEDITMAKYTEHQHTQFHKANSTQSIIFASFPLSFQPFFFPSLQCLMYIKYPEIHREYKIKKR